MAGLVGGRPLLPSGEGPCEGPPMNCMLPSERRNGSSKIASFTSGKPVQHAEAIQSCMQPQNEHVPVGLEQPWMQCSKSPVCNHNRAEPTSDTDARQNNRTNV